MQRFERGANDTLPLENNGDYTRDVGFIKFSDFTSNISAADSVTVDNHLNSLWYQPEEIFPVDGIPEQRQHALWVPVNANYYRIAKKLEVNKGHNHLSKELPYYRILKKIVVYLNRYRFVE